ncbi:MAG TPA: hypothetical protein VFW50_00225, partial [Streptosporangiaceae bacterium]|nr:hypothetical protein [Streptosporangiaceae bacterium]
LGPVSAADIALLRPPSAMWGYNMQVTDAALDQIARAMRERDVTIAYLQDQLASAQRSGSYDEPRGAHARPAFLPPPSLAALEPAGDRGARALSEGQAALAPFEAHEDFEARKPFETPEPHEAPEPEHYDAEDYGPEGYGPEGYGPEDYGPEGYDSEEPDAPEESGAPEELADLEPLEPLEASGPPAAEPPAAEAGPAGAQPAGAQPAAAAPADTRPWPAGARPAEASPAGTRPAADVPTFTPTPTYRQTPFVLKASGPKPPPAPEPREVTQPSVIREAAEEQEDHDPTQPNQALSPQGSFDTHDWWAEQTEAAQKERARRQAAGETDLDTEEEAEEGGRPDGDPLAAEEQGW